MIYQAATYNLSLRQLARLLRKNPNTIMKALRMENVKEAIKVEKLKARRPREKQMETIDTIAINRVEDILKTADAEPSTIVNLLVKHLKGRGIYVENEKVEHGGHVTVTIAPELEDKPPEEKKI